MYGRVNNKPWGKPPTLDECLGHDLNDQKNYCNYLHAFKVKVAESFNKSSMGIFHLGQNLVCTDSMCLY